MYHYGTLFIAQLHFILYRKTDDGWWFIRNMSWLNSMNFKNTVSFIKAIIIIIIIIIIIMIKESLKEGRKIWWAYHVWRLFTKHSFPSIAEKIFFVPDIQVYHSQESQQPGKWNAIKISWRRSDPIRCLAVMKLACSVFAYKEPSQSALFMSHVSRQTKMQLRSTHSHRFVYVVGWIWLSVLNMLKSWSSKLHGTPNSAMNLELTRQ